MTVLDAYAMYTLVNNANVSNILKYFFFFAKSYYLWVEHVELDVAIEVWLVAGICGVFNEDIWNPAANNNKLAVAPGREY